MGATSANYVRRGTNKLDDEKRLKEKSGSRNRRILEREEKVIVGRLTRKGGVREKIQTDKRSSRTLLKKKERIPGVDSKEGEKKEKNDITIHLPQGGGRRPYNSSGEAGGRKSCG